MNQLMSQHYRAFCRGWDTFYCQDLTTGNTDSYFTRVHLRGAPQFRSRISRLRDPDEFHGVEFA